MRYQASVSETVGRVAERDFHLGFGPSPYTRTKHIRVTMLGNPKISAAWPLYERVGLLFKDGDRPLNVIEKLMRKQGFQSPEELRERFSIPSGALTCRNIECDSEGLIRVDSADSDAVLRQALMLGLCGPTFYDPQKAVIWTNNRLSRRLELFQPERWYADN